MNLQIEKVDNGFIVTEGPATRIASTLEEVFDDILMHFEGRADSFTGESYGTVIILRCTCFKTSRGTDTDNACSRCSQRLAMLT